MSLIHANPDNHGKVFGHITVTVDLSQADCVFWVRPIRAVGSSTKRIHFHNLDEIRGAYAQHHTKTGDPRSVDMAKALKHAGTMLNPNKGTSRND